jgi:hypothetical protein
MQHLIQIMGRLDLFLNSEIVLIYLLCWALDLINDIYRTFFYN